MNLAEDLTLAIMRHYGYTAEDIAAVEAIHPGRVCDEDACYDEDGKTVHSEAWVDLGQTANLMVDVVVPHVERVLANAFSDGYSAATTMARCYGHTDHWPGGEGPINPYSAD